MIKVSVVVPVYNVEPFLKQALDSLINQTLQEIEIIAVNDGSTDRSLEILKEYENIDNRIIIISQENKGLSEARNAGLRVAKGNYVYFMDSDDYIDGDMLEICFLKSEKYRLEILFFDAISFSDENMYEDSNIYSRNGFPETKTMNGCECLEYLMKMKKYRSSVCLNFIQTNYLQAINLSFYPSILHEDELFTFILYYKCRRIGYINRDFFKRRIRPNSITTTKKNENNILGYLTVAKEISKIKPTLRAEEKIIKNRITGILGAALLYIHELESKDSAKKYIDIIKYNFKNDLNFKLLVKVYFPKINKIIINFKKNRGK